MWSLGVLLYILIGGTSPFLVDSVDLTKDNICSVRYTFPSKNFKAVSVRVKEMISGLLVGDQRLVVEHTHTHTHNFLFLLFSARLTAAQCLQHAWTQQLQSPDNTVSHDDTPSINYLTHLKSYVSTRKWQTSSFTVSTATEH